MTTEIRWLWLKYKLCRVKSLRVIVSGVKYRDQRIHVYVVTSWYMLLSGERARVANLAERYSYGWTNPVVSSCLLVLLI